VTASTRGSGAIATAAPALVFVGVDFVSSLQVALIAASVAAVVAVAWRALRKQSLKQPLIGVVIVAVGAVIASFTGEARGFFLLPALIPFVVVAACVVTLVVRRPLTGLLLNRVCGGPADWPEHSAVRRVYARTTVACLVLDAANAAIQFVFYQRSDTVVLAIAHIATGPMFAAIVAATVTYARRALRDPRSDA
jgi:hypothetical protein